MGKKRLFLFFVLFLAVLASSVHAQTAPNPLNTSFYWTFDNAEYSAPTLFDLTPNQTNLTNFGSITTSLTGIYGQSFNYTAGWSKSVKGETIKTNEAFTINCWFRDTNGITDNAAMLGTTATDGGYVSGYLFLYETSTSYTAGGQPVVVIEGVTNGNQVVFHPNTGKISSEWTMNTIIFNGITDTCQYWMNATNRSLTYPAGSCSLTSEGINTGGNNSKWSIMNFDGSYSIDGTAQADECMVYRNELTPANIVFLYNLGAPSQDQQYPFGGEPFVNATVGFNATVLEGVSQTVYLNLTKDDNVTNTSASLYYDGVVYSAGKTSGLLLDQFEVNLTTPRVANGSVVGLFWAYNFTLMNGSVDYANTSNESQTILAMLISNCTNAPVVNNVVNFTIRDEETNALINASTFATYMAWYRVQSLNVTGSLGWNVTSNPKICKYPPQYEFGSSFEIGYDAVGYSGRQYFLFANLTNATQSITLYLLNESSSTAVTINVVDSSDNPLEGYVVEVYKYNIGTGVSLLVGAFATNSAGEGIVDLVLNEFYTYKVYTGVGALVLSTTPELLVSTQKTLVVGSAQSPGVDEWLTIYDLSCGVVFNNVTRVVETSWTHGGSISQYCLNVINQSAAGWAYLSNQCSNETSGVLSYGPLAVNYTYLAMPTATVASNNQTYVVYCGGESPLSIDLTEPAVVFGREGLFWAVLLLVLFVMMAFLSSGAEYIAMVLICVWFAVTSISRLLPLPYAVIISIVAFLIAVAIGLRRER